MPEETQKDPETQQAPDDAQQQPPQADAAPPEDQAETPETAQADDLPANAVAVEDAGTLKKKITVTVPRERIDAKLDEMYGELLHTAQIPGFRIGRAPRRLVEKRFGTEVAQDVRNSLVGEAIGSAAEQADLKTLGEPEIDLDEIKLPDEGEMSFSFEVEVAPEFDLPKLKGIEVSRPAIVVNDERIDETLDRWRQGQARFEVTDEAARADDMVQASATVAIEGLEPTEVPGLSLRVAPGQIEGLPLVDLAEALAGKKAGQAASLTVAVPEAHPNEEWRGKQAAVEVKLSQVRRQVLPAVDEPFAESLGYDSLAELREDVSRRLEATVERDARRAMRDQVCTRLLAQTSFDLPPGVVARYTDRVLQRRMVELLQRGVPRNRIDENLTELQAAAGEQAQRELKLAFILGKIAEEQDIDVTDEEVNSRVAEMAGMYGRRPERIRQELAADGSLETLASSLREEKVLDKLLGDAKIKEVSPDDQADEKDNAGATKAKKKPAKKPEKKSKKKAAGKSKSKAAATGEKKPAAAGKKKKDSGKA